MARKWWAHAVSLGWVALAATAWVGCESEGESPSADAGAMGGMESVVPDRPFPEFTTDDLVTNDVLGVVTVAERLLIGFEADASSASIAAALATAAQLGAEIEGGLPEGGVALLRLPGATAAELDAARTALEALDGVSGASELRRIGPALVPRSADRTTAPFWSWLGESWPLPATPATGLNGTWALRSIAAPGAWNLLPWLRARPGGFPRTRVGVIDVEVYSHPDVPFLRVGAAGNTTRGELSGHGLTVAGVIGATWGNGEFSDGVSPAVELSAISNRVVEADIDAQGITTDAAIFSKSSELLRAAARPRLLNISMGESPSQDCNGDFRCDLRGPGPGRAPDSRCNVEAGRARVRSLGNIFAAYARQVQAGGPVLWIQSAGNDSGPHYDHADPGTLGCPDDVTLEGTETYCRLVALGCSPRSGLGGRFPATLSSPLAVAATLPGFSDVLIVEAGEPAETASSVSRLTDFSESEGQIVAPGRSIVSAGVELTDSSLTRTLRDFDGTSFSAPLVTGVAAWLLSIDPSLTNAELRAALTGFAPGAIEGTSTRARLDMVDATLALDELRPMRTPALATVLADVDDGTPDGFTRQVLVRGEWRPYTGTKPLGAAPVLDMADFRAMRDVYLYQRELLRDPCPTDTPACDLNGDGAVQAATLEAFPRTHIVTGQSPFMGRTSIAFLGERRAFADPVQGYRGRDLVNLVKSADVHVEPSAFMQAAGADELRITLDGERFPDDPVADATPLFETPITGPTVLTTHLRKSPRITVHVARGGVVDDMFLSADLAELTPGEDRHLTLNPCAWTRGEGLLDPPSPACGGDDALPDPTSHHFWLRVHGADVTSTTYVFDTLGNDEIIYSAYEPFNDRSFVHAAGVWRGHEDITLLATMEWLGGGPGTYSVGSFHEGAGLPTGISFSADSPFDERPQRVNIDITSVDVAITVTESGPLPGDSEAGTFHGDGRYSDSADPERVGLPVTIEGGFRTVWRGNVENPN